MEPNSTPNELSLPDLLQFAAMNRTTRGLLLFGKSANGQLEIVEGQLVHAVFGELVGEEAIYSALSDEELRTQPAPRSAGSIQRSVFLTIPHLLLEGARRADEGLTRTPQIRELGSCSAPLGTGAVWDSLLPATSAARRTRKASYWTLGAVLLAVVTVVVTVLATILQGGDLRTKNSMVAASSHIAPTSAPTAVELTGEMVSPVMVNAALPPRPDVGIAVSPTVVVRTLIDADGRVQKTQIYRSRLDLASFEEAAVAYLQSARFLPATKQGAPLAVWMNYPVSFAPMVRTATTLSIHGSDTIGAALGPDLAKRFEERTGTKVAIQALGSASAFSSLFADTAQLGASSRPIDAKELAQARSLGIELVEFVLGYDGIAVIVNSASSRERATLLELSTIFSGQGTRALSSGAANSEVLHLYGRPSYSGTQNFFRSRVLRLSDEASELDYATTTVLLEKSEELASRVAQDPLGIGYVGLGAIRQGVKVLAIAPSEGKAAVLPTVESIRSGKYPIYRPLLFYSKSRPEKPVVEFLQFALGVEGQSIVKMHGFVPNDTVANLSSLESPLGGDTARSQVFRISFAEGSTMPNRDATTTLSAIVEHARERKSRLLVVGNSDSHGQSDSNNQLAARRASRVASDLRILGVPGERIRVESSAANTPVDTNDTTAGRASNRRVDVFLVDP